MMLRYFVLLTVASVTVAFSASGCGQSQKKPLSGESLTREILHLQQGISAESVKSRLGEPNAEEGDGKRDALSYGIWQLAFVRDHLVTRSKFIVPPNSHPLARSHEVNSVIRKLKLGTNIGVVRTALGVPEALYVIYEDDPRPVKILRYGSWELTFVHRKLAQRAQ